MVLRQVLVVALTFVGFSVCAQGVVSDFAANDEGWTAPSVIATPTGFAYTATGGNPNGYVSAKSPGSFSLSSLTVWYPFWFYAPVKFRGNKSAFYGGNLRFDVSQSTSVPLAIQWVTVQITDVGGVSIYYHPSPPYSPPTFGTWTTFDVQLTAATGYWKTIDDPAGTAATQAQIQSVLTNINDFRILGVYSNANVTTRLDNVTLFPPITVNTQPVNRTVCDGITTTFATAASNNPNIGYHWQHLDPVIGWIDVANTGGYSGATTTTLSVNTTGNFGAGNYRCRITGTAVSDALTNAVSLTINSLPTPPTTNGASSCTSAALTLSASGAAAGQYRWYTLPSGAGLIGGQTNSSYTTPVLSTTTTYYAAINNGTCESTRTAVTATINTPPTAPTVTNGSGCIPGTVALSASGGAAGQYRWYTLPSGGGMIAGQTNSTYTTPTLSTTTNYYVSIDNGSCESPGVLVTATMNTPPSAPAATGGTGCSPASIALTASGATVGQYRWYTVPTGGIAIAGETNSTYTTPGIAVTSNYYVSIDNGTCEGPKTTVIATVNTSPAAPTATGATVCGSGTATLTAGGGTTGQYRWYTVPTGGTAIAGETNGTYTTPALSTSTNYYVSINNGTCESTRTLVTATASPAPVSPTVTSIGSCNAASVTLTASGGTAGQYRWYTTATGGTAISGAVNGSYVTPVLSSTTIFYVTISNGTCESARVPVTATIGGVACSNNPPVIEPAEASTTIGGTVSIDLMSIISDADNNLLLSTLTIATPPASGAIAKIDVDNNLIVDYTGITFVGKESVTIRICDTFSACTLQAIEIEVDGSIEVFNAVSPNKDGKNDVFFIENIEKLADTKKNHVAIFNRWGDMVWEASDYNNTTVAFNGISKNNSELPSGTYYYKIEFSGGKKTETGYLELKR